MDEDRLGDGSGTIVCCERTAGVMLGEHCPK